MTDEGVNVVGFNELKYGTAELFAKIEKNAGRQLRTVARQRANMTGAAVPVVTGRMRDSIRVGGLTGGEAGAYAGIGDSSAPYAGWIEFGGTRGRPYIPEGRYLFPIALEAGTLVEKDMSTSAKNTIKGFQWPPVPTTE